MKTYTTEELRGVLEQHRKWWMGNGGTCANLSGAGLSRANLSRADLSGADLSGANLSGADLSGADLSGANLSGAGLSGADLSRADLSRADLSGANLSGADLSRAGLSRANLSGADLSGAKWNGSTQWPAITAVLLANWGEVSGELCRDLMRYDAAAHPDPSTFDRWAFGDGKCPYADVKVQRAAVFTEKKELWSPGSVRPYDVFQRLLAEKLVKV